MTAQSIFRADNARATRPQALLQTPLVVMTRLLPRRTPRRVQAMVVVLEVIVKFVILFLRVVIWLLNIFRAEPAK